MFEGIFQIWEMSTDFWVLEADMRIQEFGVTLWHSNLRGLAICLFVCAVSTNSVHRLKTSLAIQPRRGTKTRDSSLKSVRASH